MFKKLTVVGLEIKSSHILFEWASLLNRGIWGILVLQILLSFLFLSSAHAETSTIRSNELLSQEDVGPALFGHNLTPTSYTLRQGGISAGSYALAYGVTDHLTIGTSPWLIAQYNMPMISMKYSFAGDEFVQQFMLETDYFKTFPYGLNLYQQESLFARVAASHRFSKTYTLHVSGGYQYFFDAGMPYSLRLVPGNDDLYTLSASTLNELRFGRFGAFIEAGLLGLNYVSPYMHTGASVFYRWKSGMIQVGASRTAPMGNEVVSKVIYSQDSQYMIYFIRSAVYHPEVQLQFLL